MITVSDLQVKYGLANPEAQISAFLQESKLTWDESLLGKSYDLVIENWTMHLLITKGKGREGAVKGRSIGARGRSYSESYAVGKDGQTEYSRSVHRLVEQATGTTILLT